MFTLDAKSAPDLSNTRLTCPRRLYFGANWSRGSAPFHRNASICPSHEDDGARDKLLISRTHGQLRLQHLQGIDYPTALFCRIRGTIEKGGGKLVVYQMLLFSTLPRVNLNVNDCAKLFCVHAKSTQIERVP